MELSELTFGDQPPVDAYGPGFFRVQEQMTRGNLWLNSQGVLPWAGFDDLQPILQAKDLFDILFVGMGADISPLPAVVRRVFDEAEIAAEVMSSASACRTYNILLSEGRRVAIAALAVE